jgi:hypothetical protein
MRLGHSDCSLAGELASSLRYLALDVGLLGVGSCPLPLLKGVPSLKREPGVRPQCQGLHAGQSSWFEWSERLAAMVWLRWE